MASEAPSLDIHLDASLQLWVLFPIWLATLLMGLLRVNLSIISASPPRTSLAKLRDANRLKRAQLTRQYASMLPADQLHTRRAYLAGPDGVLNVSRPERSLMTAMMDPESLAAQVTSVVLTVLPNFVLFTWARYMFAGVAACKLPFSLSPRFRPMLQSGMEFTGQNLDVSYVSALSWYVLNMFGNTGLLALISSGSAQDMVFMPNVASQIAMNVSPDKVFAQERDELLKLTHDYKMHEAEDSLLEMDDFSEFASF